MVGAEGSPNALRNVVGLAQLELDAQMIVICGRNQRLMRKVQRTRARIPVCALGFVGYVADLMRSADVLVTKAGGLTLAEAFCSGVAVVVHDVVPGQESGNLEYVLSQNAVVYAPSARALKQVIDGLYADPARRRMLALRGAQLARPHAAEEIATAVLARLRPPSP